MNVARNSKQKGVSVTKVPSVGERIIAGLTELKGALKNKEPIAKRFTIRTVELDLEPQEYSAAEIQAIRDQLAVSQAIFAEIIGVSPHTIRSWEQGKREPSKTARRLMDDIKSDPSRWINRLTANRKPVAV